MFLFQKIEETMMKYMDARHAVGEFILREPETLYQYTVSEIAEKTFTSKATVVRFAKAMGYDGWKEFMKDYIAEVKYQKAHQNTVDFNIRKENLQKAADYLVKANRIVIFCSSPNTYLGELFKRKLFTIGKNASVPISSESGIVAASRDSWDCALIISYSGNKMNHPE